MLANCLTLTSEIYFANVCIANLMYDCGWRQSANINLSIVWAAPSTSIMDHLSGPRPSMRHDAPCDMVPCLVSICVHWILHDMDTTDIKNKFWKAHWIKTKGGNLAWRLNVVLIGPWLWFCLPWTENVSSLSGQRDVWVCTETSLYNKVIFASFSSAFAYRCHAAPEENMAIGLWSSPLLV